MMSLLPLLCFNDDEDCARGVEWLPGLGMRLPVPAVGALEAAK